MFASIDDLGSVKDPEGAMKNPGRRLWPLLLVLGAVHPDYRNHAQSDDDPESDLKLRLGYTEDVLNAIVALRKSALPYVDVERIGMLGRSMGGGVTLNAAVVRPDLIDAVVLFAPVSSNYVDNFTRWTMGAPERRRLAERIVAAHGSPGERPAFWRNVSPVTFFDRLSMPILLHHGTADERVPLAWSERTTEALRRLDKDARFYTYEGEPHEFAAAWTMAMARTVAFFDAHLKTG